MSIDIGTGLIVGSLISTTAMILLYMLSNRNWFKRENFKIEKSNVMQTNKIKLSQLRKELGVELKPKPKVDLSGLNLSGLIGDTEEEPEGLGGYVTQIIGNVIENNPDIVEKYAPELIKMIAPNINKEQTDNYI